MPVVHDPGSAGYTLWSEELPVLGQRGPTCGFYALSYVSMALGQFIPHTKNKSSAARVYHFKPDYSMRSVGKKLGITRVGEIFDSNHMTQLAEQFGMGATCKRVTSQNFVTTIREAIDAGKPVLVPYNVGADESGPNILNGEPDPDHQTGENPHWCTVVGYKNGRHGRTDLLVYNWDKYYRYDAGALQRANQNIAHWHRQEWAKRRNDHLGFERPKPTVRYKRRIRFPSIDLTTTLAGTVVVIDSGKERPAWKADSTADRCAGCDKEFGTFTRKHHCRECGKIFCSSCTSHTMVVYMPATRPGKTDRARSDGKVRVCDGCYAKYH